MSPTVTNTLSYYSSLTCDAMSGYLANREPATYLYDLVRDYPNRRGKGLRPALLLATCEAFGAPHRTGLSVAVALELLHNAFLIHDDIEDQALTRRGHPTLHATQGVPLAINAGDALAHLAFTPILADRGLTGGLARRVVEELSTVVRNTTEGQALELGWRAHHIVDLGPEDYLELVGKKTCWYTTIGPLRLGKLLGTRCPGDLSTLSRLGFLLGVAFQIRDDLLDLDTAGQTGKDSLTDIAEGKRTLMLIHLLNHVDGADRAWLVDYLHPRAARGPEEGLKVLQLMDAAGSLSYAQKFATGIEAAAYDALPTAFADVEPSPHLEFLQELVPYMLQRSA